MPILKKTNQYSGFNMKKKLTLKEAREKGKLKQFIKEREKNAPGDALRLEKALKLAAKGKVKTSKATQKASVRGVSES